MKSSIERAWPWLLSLAALATLSRVLQWQWLHYASKPAVLTVAIFLIAARARASGVASRFHYYLIAALGCSVAGDVLLMLPGDYFVFGLASFLLAHVCYLALLHHRLRWFPRIDALVLTLAVGAGMYAWIWPGLGDPVLRVAVAAYVGVIALMVAQALGRASLLGDAASRAVALGACLFMLSDALIAVNRFVQPIPLEGLWVLSTYYAAQLLIVRYARAPA